jgi:histidyl-tRNA synthetase
MEEQRMFPDLHMTAQVMICPLPDTPLASVVGLASRLRQAGMTVELYPEAAKLGRQLAAADALHIPYALILGPDEIARQTYTLKHLASGAQQTLDETALLTALRNE